MCASLHTLAMTQDELASRVTVGMPVRNEATHLREAIESIASQAGRIIVVDNASSDDTPRVCEEMAARYDNVEWVRHPHNIGSLRNFAFPLSMCTTEYFMWLSGHDLVDPDYVSSLAGMLDTCPDAILAYPAMRSFVDRKNTGFRYEYWFHASLASDDPLERVYCTIRHLYNCFLIHGVMRAAAAREAMVDKPCVAADHIVLTKLAILGRMIYCPHVTIYGRTIRTETVRETQDRALKYATGSDHASVGRDPYIELKHAQYGLMKSVPTRNIFKKLLYVRRARKALRNRWGRF